jgi:hypothetical protein
VAQQGQHAQLALPGLQALLHGIIPSSSLGLQLLVKVSNSAELPYIQGGARSTCEETSGYHKKSGEEGSCRELSSNCLGQANRRSK